MSSTWGHAGARQLEAHDERCSKQAHQWLMDSMGGVLVKKQNVSGSWRGGRRLVREDEGQRDTEMKRRSSYESFRLW